MGDTQPCRDYGTGYYVRSTVHPVVPGTGMTLDETVEALNTLNAIATPREG